MSNFSCFVIGDSSIALRCLQILLKNKFVVLGIYSSDRSLFSFAQEQNLTHADAIETFHNTLLNTQYDYLFSINNKWIIPSEVIACARKATINYHNSPLPKYAGL